MATFINPYTGEPVEWLTPTNVGNTYGGGDDTPQWANDYERFFGAGDIYNEAAARGYAGAMPAGESGDSTNQQFGNPQQELFDWMKASGNTYGFIPTVNGGQINAWLDASGKPIEGTLREFQGGDSNFGIASALLGAAGGSFIGAANGLGSMASGALSGGAAGGMNDPTLSSIAKGAAIGGAMGGIRDYIGTVDPLSPMEVPSTEWQNVPTGNIDAALNHVSPTLEGAIGGAAQHLTPAALESAIGTPGYGINASADAYLEGIGSPNLSGANATVPQEYLMNGNWNASGTIPDSPISPTQTIEVTGNQIDYGDGSAFPTAPATPAPTAPTGGAPIDYGDGSAFPPGDGSAWTAPPAAAPGLGSKIGDFFKANPKLAISLLGSVFGGGSSGGSGSGGAGGIGSQSGMTATQAPKFQRQYVAPPAGYRPGFDPEHKYFTGIGNVGTGG